MGFESFEIDETDNIDRKKARREIKDPNKRKINELNRLIDEKDEEIRNYDISELEERKIEMIPLFIERDELKQQKLELENRMKIEKIEKEEANLKVGKSKDPVLNQKYNFLINFFKPYEEYKAEYKESIGALNIVKIKKHLIELRINSGEVSKEQVSSELAALDKEIKIHEESIKTAVSEMERIEKKVKEPSHLNAFGKIGKLDIEKRDNNKEDIQLNDDKSQSKITKEDVKPKKDVREEIKPEPSTKNEQKSSKQQDGKDVKPKKDILEDLEDTLTEKNELYDIYFKEVKGNLENSFEYSGYDDIAGEATSRKFQFDQIRKLNGFYVYDLNGEEDPQKYSDIYEIETTEEFDGYNGLSDDKYFTTKRYFQKDENGEYKLLFTSRYDKRTEETKTFDSDGVEVNKKVSGYSHQQPLTNEMVEKDTKEFAMNSLLNDKDTLDALGMNVEEKDNVVGMAGKGDTGALVVKKSKVLNLNEDSKIEMLDSFGKLSLKELSRDTLTGAYEEYEITADEILTRVKDLKEIATRTNEKGKSADDKGVR